MGTSSPPPDFDESDGSGLSRYPTPETRLPDPGRLGVLTTIRTAVGLYGADAGKLWQVMALLIIPVQLLIFVLRAVTVPSGSVLENAKIYVPAGETGGGFSAVSAFAQLLAVMILLVSVGAVYRILLGRYLHHPADLMTSFRFALDRVIPLLWVSIVTVAVVLIGFILIIIPGIYALVCVSVAVPVLMAEDHRGLSALGRSRDLVSGYWWHVLGCLIVAAIVAGIGEAVISLIAGPIATAVAPHSITGFLLVSGLADALISILVSPFTAAVPIVLYVDLLRRKDDPQLPRLLA